MSTALLNSLRTDMTPHKLSAWVQRMQGNIGGHYPAAAHLMGMEQDDYETHKNYEAYRQANVWLANTIQSTLDGSSTRVEHFIQVVSESRPDAFQNGWLLLTLMRSFHSQLNDIDAKNCIRQFEDRKFFKFHSLWLRAKSASGNSIDPVFSDTAGALPFRAEQHIPPDHQTDSRRVR